MHVQIMLLALTCCLIPATASATNNAFTGANRVVLTDTLSTDVTASGNTQ